MRALFILLLSIWPIHAAYATEGTLNLVVVPYATPNELDVLFEHSQRPLEYLDGEDVSTTLFIGLFTRSQLETLTRSGLHPEVLDTDPDMTRYVYLYNALPDSASILSSYGDVFVLSPHHTLLKLASGVAFEHTKETSNFHVVPIPSSLARPIKKIASPLSPIVETSYQDVHQLPEKSAPMYPYIIGGVILVFALGIVYYTLKPHHKRGH